MSTNSGLNGIQGKRWWLGLLAAVLVIFAVRLSLPYFVKRYVNNTLSSLQGYYGHVEDVHIALYRGAYSLRQVRLIKTHGSEREPLFAADAVDFSVDWHALLEKRVVCKIHLIHPELQFIERPSKQASQTKMEGDWQARINKIIPLEINELGIEDGLVRYKDDTKDPKINVFLSRIELTADNLLNTASSSAQLPSKIHASARLLKTGHLKLDGRANLLAEPIIGEMKSSVRGLDLREINAYAKAYGNFEFQKGEFEVTSELAASKSNYSGYVKTIAKHVDILDWSKEKKEGKSTLHLVWEGIVSTVVDIFKNKKQDQFAARIPISGSRKDLQIDSWATLGSILKNGFVSALSPKFENSVKYSDTTRGPASESPKK